jgi:thymidylate kinase
MKKILKNKKPVHLIFEGAELSGKSWLMSQIYDHLEAKYNKNKLILDGCHWFNCDVGIFGTKHGKAVIKYYNKIFAELKNKNLLLEKFHLSDIVYNRLHRKVKVGYKTEEKFLLENNFKIILCAFPENKKILKQRIKDRLKLYPHYQRILRQPNWYIKQQQEYLKEIKKTKLPYLIIETDKLPDNKLVQKILEWVGEK